MRTDTEAEASILWPHDMKNWLIRKDPNGGKDWSQEEKGTTENEMVQWHHQLDGREFEQAPGVGDGQGSLTCCSPWGQKESDMTEWLNWTELNCSVILTLCDPQGISQARILEWVAIPFTRACFWPRGWTCISCIASGLFFLLSEPPGKPIRCRTGLYMDVLGKRDHYYPLLRPVWYSSFLQTVSTIEILGL